MKRLIVITCVIVTIVASFVIAITLKIRSQRPEVLLSQLRKAPSHKQELIIIELHMTKEDAAPAMIEAFTDPTAPEAFRILLVNLLYKENISRNDKQIAATLRDALSSPSALIRQAAVRDALTYGNEAQQLAVLCRVDDTDVRVRKEVYALLCESGSDMWRDNLPGVSKELRQRVLSSVRKQITSAEDTELQFMARSVLGSLVRLRCDQAREAQQRADMGRAEELLNEAIELDPEHQMPQIRLVRLFLRTGRRQQAIALARKHNAILRIPHLEAAPDIDGDPSEAAWTNSLKGQDFFLNNSNWTSKRAKSKSQFFLGHRDGKIYMAILGYEDDLNKLVIKNTTRDGAVWKDDCVEIFLDPTNSEKDVYQFVINAGGTFLDLYRQDVKTDVKCERAASIFPKRGYWACEFAVAARDLDNAQIDDQSIWGINIMRTRIGAGSEQCAFWPTFGFSLNFHLYPIAAFEDAAPAVQDAEKKGVGEEH